MKQPRRFQAHLDPDIGAHSFVTLTQLPPPRHRTQLRTQLDRPPSRVFVTTTLETRPSSQVIMGFFDNAWKAMDAFGQNAGKQVGSAAAETWKHLDAFGQEAGKRIGPAAAETWKNLDAFGQEAGKQVGSAGVEGWKRADAFGQEAGKHVGPAVGCAAGWVRKHPGTSTGIVGCAVAAPIAIGVTTVGLGIAGFTATGVTAGTCPLLLCPFRPRVLSHCRVCRSCFSGGYW